VRRDFGVDVFDTTSTSIWSTAPFTKLLRKFLSGFINGVAVRRQCEDYGDMPIERRAFRSVFVAAAAVAAIVATPAAVIANTPATTTHQVVLAGNGNGNVHGSGGGGAGGGGGCGNGRGWHGCGGWNPATGGFGGGCSNGVCGGWDGVRGWGNF
jgi:hypothetical protein